MVILLIREVKSAIIIVVRYIVVDHDYGFPGVEDHVGNHSSKGRAADHVVAIDVAAEDAVVEVVGNSVVVNRSDVTRNVHVAVVVVVVRVYVGVMRSGTRVRAVTVRVSSGMSARAGIIATIVIVAFVAGTTDRLRLCLTLFGVSTLDICVCCYIIVHLATCRNIVVDIAVDTVVLTS